MNIAINPGWFNASVVAEMYGKSALDFLKLPETRAFVLLMSSYMNIETDELIDRRDGDILLCSEYMNLPLINFVAGHAVNIPFEGELCYAHDKRPDICAGGIDTITDEFRDLVTEMKRKRDWV